VLNRFALRPDLPDFVHFLLSAGLVTTDRRFLFLVRSELRVIIALKEPENPSSKKRNFFCQRLDLSKFCLSNFFKSVFITFLHPQRMLRIRTEWGALFQT